MKSLFPLLLLVLCSCRTPAPVAVLPVPTRPVPVRPQPIPTIAPLPAPRSAIAAPDPKSRQQAQLIEALINQNEALTARLTALQVAPAATAPAFNPVPVSATPLPVGPAPAPVPVVPFIAPNSEGIIDLAAIEHAGTSNEPVNPFAVRTALGEKTREVSLLVGGIILGKAPCAVVNERLVQSGDSLDGFEVERIEAGAVIVRAGAHRLRLPVSPMPTRVKLSR